MTDAQGEALTRFHIIARFRLDLNVPRCSQRTSLLFGI